MSQLRYTVQVQCEMDIQLDPATTKVQVRDNTTGEVAQQSLASLNPELLTQIANEALLGTFRGTPAPVTTPPEQGTFSFKVYVDVNGNQIQDGDEPDGGLPEGTQVQIIPQNLATGTPETTITVSPYGLITNYLLNVGEYMVIVRCPEGYGPTHGGQHMMVILAGVHNDLGTCGITQLPA